MTHLSAGTLALAVGLTFSPAARAEVMSKDQHKAAAKVLEAEYQAGKKACDTQAGNAKDICRAEAKGREKVASAELEAQYAPSAKTRNGVRVAKAEAAWLVASERCDDRAGNDKDVCVKEATAARVHALADADVKLTTTQANTQAGEASAGANAKAAAIGSEVRKEAASEKVDADFAVAKEKCDALAGEPKEACVAEARLRYGKR